MIPKVLHYCWFGSHPAPAPVRHARSTWEAVMADFEIVEWNEDNTALDKSRYLRWCAENKKWAFLSDYVKADVLSEHGGVFLDTDVVAHRSLSSFLSHRAFSGFEATGFPFTAVWASEPGHPWPMAARDFMDHMALESIADEANTQWMTRLLAEQFSIDPKNDTYQEGSEGVAIYPSETFCLGAHLGWTSHLFAGSWLPEGARGQWGVEINDMHESALRLEASVPRLLVRLARLLSFEDDGKAAEEVAGQWGKWSSERLPQRVGLAQATRTLAEVLLYVGRMYGRGLRRSARGRASSSRG